jgi:hypothetical protein
MQGWHDRGWFGVGLAALLCGSSAMAQEAPAAVHAACSQYLVPAYAKVNAAKAVNIDCGCVTGLLVGRFGTEDAQVIIRLFAAGASKSAQELEAVSKEIGRDRIRAVLGKVGKFQGLGRQVDQVCLGLKKPG